MGGTRRISLAVGVAVSIAASVTSSIPASGVAGFGDVSSERFYADGVQWMVDNEITTGTGPTCFSPDDTVTRGQAAAFMWRMEGEPSAPDHPFTDVTAAWQHDAVSWMAHTGVTTGTTATTYSPDDPVTRGQLATFFHRYVGEPPVVLDPSSPACGGGADDEFGAGAIDLRQGGHGPWTMENAHLVDVADIDLSAAGSLVLVPTQTFHNGWFETSNGSIVYQETRGNFAAAIRIRVVARTDPDGSAPPGSGFNSGGFVVRDASDRDDWVMYNMGNQSASVGYGREVKTTVNASSVLNLYPQAATTHRLLVCRVGTEFHYFHGAADEAGWTEESLHHDRPDIGADVHVGIVANAWQGSPGPWVEVDAIHFGVPGSIADCTASVHPV